MRSSMLNRLATPRRNFDPTNRLDLLELKYFIQKGVWKDKCPFYEEFPWEDIPAMCKHKYAEHMISKVK
jgi:hypothetical protein